MVVVGFLATLSLLLSGVLGRPTAPDPHHEVMETLLNIQIRKCGSQLDSVLQLVCNGEFHTFSDGEGGKNTVEGRSKRGIVNECCDKMCEVRELVKYCAKAPSISSLQYSLPSTTNSISNDLRRTEATPVKRHHAAGMQGNEVRVKQRAKGRKARGERANGNGIRGKPAENKRRRKSPLEKQCMYRNFAKFLLKQTRRLERQRRGKQVKKKQQGFQVGTVKPIILGGAPHSRP